MNPAALLPHERVCPDCDDGRVPIMVPGRDEMLYTGRLEICSRCDGTSVIVNERRERDRDPSDHMITRLINTITFDRDEWKAKSERLERENKRMREAIDKAGNWENVCPGCH